MMQEGLKKILAAFHIVDDEDITEAISSLQSPDKWQQFIQQNIPSHLHQKINHQVKKILQLPTQAEHLNLEQVYNELQKMDIDISVINVLHLSQFKWSKHLANSIAESMKQQIYFNIQHCKTIDQFFRSSVQTIFDLMSRRGDLKEYFNFVKICNQQIKNKSRLNNIIKSATFTDFVVLLIKSIKQGGIIGQLLNSLAIPTPLLLEVNKEMAIHREICKKVFGFGLQEYQLFLNIGSEKTSKCGKTSLISKLMTLQQKYLGTSYFDNTLNCFTKLSFATTQRAVLLDFNGIFSHKLNSDILEMLFNIAQNASLLIIHLNETEAIENILETKQYKKLCSKVEKIIIYVRDTQKIGLKRLNKSIPAEITDKTMLRALRNLSKIHEPFEYIKQINEIVSKSYNKLNPKFSINVLCNQMDRQILRTSNQIVGDAISQFYSDNFAKQRIMPNVCKVEELLEVTSEIKQSNSIQKLKEYKEKERKLRLSLKKPQITSFIKKIVKIIGDQDCHQIFSQKLYQWKKLKIEPLVEEYLKLTEQIHLQEKQQISQKIYKNELARRNYQISIDKIINELIICNQVKKNQEYLSLIKKFYSKSIKNLSPINLIDGKTLFFGNSVLQQELINLSKNIEETNKKIYVVSVIGAQSSAKSTLLNFLFRCRFETSAGRCTKGVYMSFCQIEDMIIVVLDTEGLLSITERDVAFDHQIATFVLKISDLIIINNKGQLTSTLKQMLEVCLYVLQCLNLDQQKTEYSPHKIIFALRDQTEPKGKFQEQMAAQIKFSLEQMVSSSNLDYKNFFNIEAEDILSFPNAFIQNSGLVPDLPSITLNNKIFQKCIMGMRKRIFDCLRNSPHKSNLAQVYNQANKTWQTIQKCGKQIMNYKSVNEIVTKNKLWQTFELKIPEYTTIIQQGYDNFFDKINSINSSFELEEPHYKQQISQIFTKNYKNISDEFLNVCSQMCTNRQWIKSFLPKIERLCMSYVTSNNEKYRKKIQELKNEEKNEDLKNKLNQIISKIIKQSLPSQIVIQKFRSSAKSIMSNLRRTKQDICKPKLELEIKTIFQNILSLRYGKRLQINHIQDCQECYRKNIEERNYKSLFNLPSQFFWYDSDDKTIQNLVQRIDKNFSKKVRQYLKNANIILPSEIQNTVKQLQSIINNAETIMQNQIRLLNKTFVFTNISLREYNYRMCLFGKAYIISKDQVYQKRIQIIEMENAQIEENISKYQQSLKKIIENKGNFEKMLKDEIYLFQRNLILKNIAQFKNVLIEGVDKLSQRFIPESIFCKAMQQTILKRDFTDKKSHYIQCFKVIKDINHYLFQIMCKQPEISTRSVAIAEATSKIIEETKRTISQLQMNLQAYSSMQKTHLLKQLLIKSNMIGLASMESKQISLKAISQSLLLVLSEKKNEIINNMSKNLQSENSQAIIVKYIQGSLKDKILGCQHHCPICGMKCMLPTLHQEGHHVLNNCHSLAAFGGSSYVKSKQPVLQVCQQKDNMKSIWVQGQKQYENLKAFIDKEYSQWSEDFPNVNEPHKFQKFTDILSLKQIWANIQKAIIKSKTFRIKHSSLIQIKMLRDQGELTEADLEVEYERPLTGTKYRLKDY